MVLFTDVILLHLILLYQKMKFKNKNLRFQLKNTKKDLSQNFRLKSFFTLGLF